MILDRNSGASKSSSDLPQKFPRSPSRRKRVWFKRIRRFMLFKIWYGQFLGLALAEKTLWDHLMHLKNRYKKAEPVTFDTSIIL